MIFPTNLFAKEDFITFQFFIEKILKCNILEYCGHISQKYTTVPLNFLNILNSKTNLLTDYLSNSNNM